ncbi:MAG: UDP-glucuronic acid decarboxylase family protein [Planctomycetota bacterium]
MRTLVAGCAGFIGYHLSERLLAEGHEVVGADSFISGSRANVERLARHAAFEFHEHDITAPLQVEPRCARIYDMACPASPADFGPHSLEILATCSRGVWNLLDLARRHGARLLHASTSEVYGDPQEHPQRETYWGHVNPIGARACYDEGKRFAEALLTSYRAQHGIEVRIPRIFNTYGPYMRRDDGRMLPTFIDQALRGEPLTVHGDGSQTRSFCYVSDLIDGLMRLMECDAPDAHLPVNLGNPVEITILEAAREVIELTGSRSEIRFVPRPPDDPALRRPDITRARTLLGWEPRVERREGFARTIEAFQRE